MGKKNNILLDTLLQFRHKTDQFQIQKEFMCLVLPRTKSECNS
jgi:hypothetical protein